MKFALIAASLFVFSFPAHAQTLVNGNPAPSQLNLTGGGGAGAPSAVSFSFTLPMIDRTTTHYSYIYAQGSDATFEPTRFVSFNKAVEMGREALAYRPKSIVEVAAECRAAKKRIR